MARRTEDVVTFATPDNCGFGDRERKGFDIVGISVLTARRRRCGLRSGCRRFSNGSRVGQVLVFLTGKQRGIEGGARVRVGSDLPTLDAQTDRGFILNPFHVIDDRGPERVRVTGAARDFAGER